MRSPQNLHNRAVGSSVLLDPLHSSQHAVAMHRLADILGRNEKIATHIFRAIVRNDEAVAVFMHLQAPGQKLAAQTRDDILAAAERNQLSALHQPVERFFHLLARFAFDAELSYQILV